MVRIYYAIDAAESIARHVQEMNVWMYLLRSIIPFKWLKSNMNKNIQQRKKKEKQEKKNATKIYKKSSTLRRDGNTRNSSS